MNRELKIYLSIIFTIFLLFFLYKTIKLSLFDIYDGVIIAVEKKTIRERSLRSSSKFTYHTPVVRYNTLNDTVIFTDPEYVMFVDYRVGDRVKVIEYSYKIRTVSNDPKIYSFLYYWLDAHELLILIALSMFIHIARVSYLNKKILK